MAPKPRKYARKWTQDGPVARSSPLTRQIEVVLASFGYGQFVRLMRRKLLKPGKGSCELAPIIRTN
jgi:hypothetical protein